VGWLASLSLLLATLGGCPDAEASASAPGRAAPQPAAAQTGAASVRPEVRLRVVLVSDLNDRYGSTEYGPEVHAAVNRIVAMSPDLVLCAGDMVAGQRRGLDQGAMWRAFHAAVTGRLEAAHIPFAVTPGNHDGSAFPGHRAERRAFVAAWDPDHRPEVAFLDGSRYPIRYSFTAGPALFVSLDATVPGPLAPEQMAWLRAQLEAGVDHRVKVVMGHLPLYAVGQGRETEILNDSALEALFRDLDVDVYVSGHHHAFYPGRRGPLRLLSLGCLGGGPRHLIGDTGSSPRSLTLLEIGAEDIVAITPLGGPAFDRPLPLADLPRRIEHGGVVIGRDEP